jgi:uncharacterized protein (TIGR02147 family)
MKHQIAVQQLLQARLTEAKTKNPSFSLRAFARKIGLSHTMTSRVLAGKRQVSRDLAQRITQALLLDPQETSEILSQFPEKRKHRTATDTVDPLYLQLTADHFRMISEWYYFAILSLLKTKDFKNDPTWIAARLALPVATVEQALDRLKRLEIVSEDARGKLTRAAPRYRTTDDLANLSLRKAHFNNLELARKSLETDSVSERDFSSLTLAFRSDRLAEAKSYIRKFQDEFDAKFEGEEKAHDEVYRLTVGLFPLTRSKMKMEKI